jgi:hypothetical protein
MTGVGWLAVIPHFPLQYFHHLPAGTDHQIVGATMGRLSVNNADSNYVMRCVFSDGQDSLEEAMIGDPHFAAVFGDTDIPLLWLGHVAFHTPTHLG